MVTNDQNKLEQRRSLGKVSGKGVQVWAQQCIDLVNGGHHRVGMNAATTGSLSQTQTVRVEAEAIFWALGWSR